MSFRVVAAREETVLVDLVEAMLLRHHVRGQNWDANAVIALMGRAGVAITTTEMNAIGPVLLTRGVITAFP